jgi:hypothetical protein
MYRRYRRWRLVHWALSGEPESWQAQLHARYAERPVFAVLSGISYDTWEPVHAFCERQRVPCLLPMAWMPPATADFYSIYFSSGLDGEARAVAERLARDGVREAVAWTASTPTGRRQRAAIGRAFESTGVRLVERPAAAASAAISALSADHLLAQLRDGASPPSHIYVLGGALDALPDRWPAAGFDVASSITVATDLAQPAAARTQLARSRVWVNAKRIAPSSERVAVNALLAATIVSESLLHVDESFSREYCIEKIEHTLENMPAMTAYPRLSLGPGQRFATRDVRLAPLHRAHSGPRRSTRLALPVSVQSGRAF